MNTILVIDDSATIRRLVDTNLSPLGYRVVMAETAEAGVDMAEQARPDMILLDHQLPGTTGTEVCKALQNNEVTREIPVVVSSTLRNRAYAEYSELPNVVDMLPKPYAPELLTTTVSNVLETGALIVKSQIQGSAVPEVIDVVGESDLAGSLGNFSIRQVLDFLNNSLQQGCLEIDGESSERIWFDLADGRVRGVRTNRIDSSEMREFLPESLRKLSPFLDLAVQSGSASRIDGFVQMLDKKVMDERLLKKLLRMQAAYVTLRSFTQPLKSFRFVAKQEQPPLVNALPLETSVLALLVDATIQSNLPGLPVAEGAKFVRQSLRGQNLDRAGLSARYMKVLSHVTKPVTCSELSELTGIPTNELQRVLWAFCLADLVCQQDSQVEVLILEPDQTVAAQLGSRLSVAKMVNRSVRDRVSLKLALRRFSPNIIVFESHSTAGCQLANDVFRLAHPSLSDAKWLAVLPGEDVSKLERLAFRPDGTIPSSFTSDQIRSQIASLLETTPRKDRSSPVDLDSGTEPLVLRTTMAPANRNLGA